MTFSGMVELLEAEQWLIRMDDLLKATWFQDANKVDINKI